MAAGGVGFWLSEAAHGPRALRNWVIGHTEADVPRTPARADVAVKWWADEVMLQAELAAARVRLPSTDFRRRLRDELDEALERFAAEGWLDDPRRYHRDPPPLEAVSSRHIGMGRFGFEHVRFDSGYEPHLGEPGRDRWLDYRRNRTAHAWVLRHDDGDARPWIVAVNGYRTGEPLSDLVALRARHLHRRLGVDVAVLVQPLHGPRSEGRSGDRVMFSGPMNTVHTAAQSAWDLRRLISWARGVHGAPTVGITGLSLGGLVVSLVAGLEPDLDAVVAGVPEPDLVRGRKRFVEPYLPPFYEQWGLSWGPLTRVHSVVSPMAMPVVVPSERLFIYAGLVDRWVRPGNVVALAGHWGEPMVLWYEGGHLSFPFEASVGRFVERAFASRGVVAPGVAPADADAGAARRGP